MLDFLLPPRCAGCDREGNFLCDQCMTLLPKLTPPICALCANPSNGRELCPRCRILPLKVDGIHSPFRMEGVVQRVVHLLKYSNMRSWPRLWRSSCPTILKRLLHRFK